jgi:hypothetical protein
MRASGAVSRKMVRLTLLAEAGQLPLELGRELVDSAFGATADLAGPTAGLVPVENDPAATLHRD